jgi:hypothetical protein
MKDSLPDLLGEMTNLPAYISAFLGLNEIAALKRKELLLREQTHNREKHNKLRIFRLSGIVFVVLGLSFSPLVDVSIFELDNVRIIISSAFIGLGGCLLYFSR